MYWNWGVISKAEASLVVSKVTSIGILTVGPSKNTLTKMACLWLNMHVFQDNLDNTHLLRSDNKRSHKDRFNIHYRNQGAGNYPYSIRLLQDSLDQCPMPIKIVALSRNTSQCRSLSINYPWSALIGIDPYWSAILIGIGHWSRESCCRHEAQDMVYKHKKDKTLYTCTVF